MSLKKAIKKKRNLKKVILLGSGAVGKTTFLEVLYKDQPLNTMKKDNIDYHRTLFFTFETIDAATITESNTKGKLQVYDLAGQLSLPIHATRDIPETVLESVDLVIFMIANDNIQSLLDVEQWLKIIDDYFLSSKEEPPSEFILVNNKVDLESNIDSKLISGILKHDKRFIKHFEISCLTGGGITELKEWLVTYCFVGECDDE